MIRKPVLNIDSPVYEQNLSLQILKRREPLKCVIRAVSAKTCRKLAELRPIIVSKLAPFPFYFGAISENIMRQIEKILARLCVRFWRHSLFVSGAKNRAFRRGGA